MYSIYKGYNFPITITSDKALDLSQSRLYNPPTKSSCVLSNVQWQVSNGTYQYLVIITPEQTALLPVGVYSIEIRDSNGYMAEFVPQFAKVVDTAYVNVEHDNSSSD